MTTSSLSISLALLGGVLNVLSPCVLPILPVLLGRSLQSHIYGPIALLGGLITGFALAGSLLGVTASWFTGLANLLRNGAIALLFFLGLLTIFPTWSYRIFSYFPVGNWAKKPPRIGLMGEFWLGTQLGLLWTPCAGPVLGGILVLAAVNHQVINAFWLLLAYGIGAGLPLLAIAYGGRVLSQRILNLRSHSAALQRIGGVAIVATAIAILLGWDVRVQLWLAPFFPTQPL
ncbi:cytochrome c biogenesis protein, transmembrane region [Nostoc commune NIES-4072]|uniref:Cytochrome c biogenesis protein, transmembrane region n=1 Tax=Nostoc commune NIES-4072 TaxID=2005467 RepID=A0A2R5FHM9_NOSCO|nr:cytochrome c biogenesis CcdA family protein [Nostoc commune]BBD64502.1 cytochrome c biogenesis protein, transmembrane region [Nostoc commune HK-02]GBG18172.1 cytochrome c biogenesis protein, transmembrane region [Nostoc commune NIES-4072]